MNRLLAMAILLSGLSAPAALAGNRALLVAINDYPVSANGRGPLEGPLNDLAAMNFAAIGSLGYDSGEIMTLTDAEATREGILNAIQTWLIDGTEPGNEVLFYFSGHGSRVPDDNGDETVDGRDEVLVPVDYQKPGQFIRDDELRDLLNKLDGRFVTVIIDACNSGTISRDMTGPNPFEGSRFLRLPDAPDPPPVRRHRGWERVRSDAGVLDLEPTETREAWSASSAAQLAYETTTPDGQKRGVFTLAFLEAVAEQAGDENGDGDISRSEALEHARARSDAICQTLPGCRLQETVTPQLEAPHTVMALPVGAWTAKAPDESGRITFVDGEPLPPPSQQAPAALPRGAEGARLTVRHEDGFELYDGAPIKFEITAPVAGKLILLFAGDDDRLIQLYPHPAGGEAVRFEAGRTLTLPDERHRFAYDFVENGAYIAVLVHDNAPTERLTTRARTAVAEPLTYLGELANILNQPWLAEDHTRPARWAVAEWRR